MFKNYFIVAWRNLLRNRVFSIINITGLAIGLSVCALIYQYIQFEVQYDRFNTKADRLYRVALENDTPTGKNASATNHPSVGPAMERDFPEVEAYSRFSRLSFFANAITLSYEGKGAQPVTFDEEHMFLVDAPFLTMFSYPLTEGDPATALKAPRSIVISESTRKKFFGNEPGLGKQLNVNRQLNLTVTGVMKDVPQNSHLAFNVLISFSTVGDSWGFDQWRWPEFYNYVLLKPGANAKNLESKFPRFVDKYLGDVKREYKWKIRMFLQPVTSIHLTSHLNLEQDVNGSERMVYFLGILGVFILVVAWINYINLSTAKSLERSKEVGLRKVVGASKGQLITQFFFDALLINGLAMLLAFILLAVSMPYFEILVGKNISAVLYEKGLWHNRDVWFAALGILLTGTLIVGAYPALLLSSFNPALVLKGKFYKSSSGILLRQFLVSFQYVLSIILIAGTIIIYKQLSYMQNEELGYAKDEVLVLKSPAVFDSTILDKVAYFKNQLAQLPAVNHSTCSSGIPGHVLLERNGARKANQNPDDDIVVYQQSIDEDFLATFEIQMVAGRNLNLVDKFIYDKPTQILVNEEMSRRLGFAKPADALHEKVTFGMGPNPQHAEIVGVIKDYHQVSLKDGYESMMYIFPSFPFFSYFAIHTNVKQAGPTIAAVKEIYSKAFPHNEFHYFFLDDYFNRQYQGDVRMGTIFGIFTALAIVIACLGLFGLSVFAVVHRTKEVGVRKVLGASVPTILLLFSKDFVKLLLISYLIALPIVYFAANNWLTNFAFHFTPGWEVFLTPLVFLLIISLGTVSFISFKAAISNPTISLRQE